MILYQRIQLLKKERKLSTYAIEKGAKLSAGAIESWKDSIPSVNSILKVAGFFDVSVDYLLGNTDNPLSHKAPIDSVAAISKLEKEFQKFTQAEKVFNQASQNFQINVQDILSGKTQRQLHQTELPDESKLQDIMVQPDHD